MDPATFRPVARGQGALIVAGAGGGALLGALVGMPVLVAALFGGAAAAIAGAVRHVAGLRVVASAERLEVHGGPGCSGRWEELRLGFGRATRRDGGDLQRYAIVADAAGRSLAFGELAGRAPCDPVRGANGASVEVVDLQGAPFLLALLVQRVPAWHVLPDWLAAAPAEPPPLEAAPAAGPAPAPAAAPKPGPAGRSARLGLLAVAWKLGGKLIGTVTKVGAGAAKAVSGTQLGLAAASAAAWSLLFSWQFALALLLQLLVHEYGHVHAMKRTGMRVRGMYLIPFLGAVAVSEDAFSSRRQQAYVALNGPLWGALLTILPLGLFLATGSHFWAAVASWWAIINLFNLLPITPLDGGRAMQAFAMSFSSNLGVAVGVLGLAGAVALGSAFGFGLIWIIAFVGGLELVAESQARAGGRALRLLPEPARFGPAHFQYLRAVLGPPPAPQAELVFARDLARMEQAARVAPMRPREVAGFGLLYASLAGVLLGLVWWLAHLPGAREAAQILT
jgi:Zn-dependent protease